jgi:hypothetical protein
MKDKYCMQRHTLGYIRRKRERFIRHYEAYTWDKPRLRPPGHHADGSYEMINTISYKQAYRC